MLSKIKKRGSLLDPLLIIIVLFVLGFVAVLGFKISGAINDNIQASTVLDDSQKQIVQANHDAYVSVWDIGFLIAFIFLLGGIVIGAFLIDTHPVFFPIFLFLAILLIFVAAIMGNVFYDATTGELATERVSFPIIIFVMDNFVKIIVITVLAAAGALYAKSRFSQ